MEPLVKARLADGASATTINGSLEVVRTILNRAASLRDQNTLIGADPTETMTTCACVLAFLEEFHLRECDLEPTPNVQYGEGYVIKALQDALKKQAKAMEQAKHAEVAHG